MRADCEPVLTILQFISHLIATLLPLPSEYSPRQVSNHLREERDTRADETHTQQGEDSRDFGEICKKLLYYYLYYSILWWCTSALVVSTQPYVYFLKFAFKSSMHSNVFQMENATIKTSSTVRAKKNILSQSRARMQLLRCAVILERVRSEGRVEVLQGEIIDFYTPLNINATHIA